MKICQFWGSEFMSLSQKFLARHHFKAELYRYIYIAIFGKHLSALYRILLMCFYNPGHILALFNNLAQVRIATSKTILDIYHNKLATRVASGVAKRL